MALTGTGGSDIDVQIGGDASDLNNALDSGISKLTSLEGALGAAGAAMAAFAAEGLRRSISGAADLDAALTQSTAIMGDVSSAMRDDMSDAAREVARSTTFAAEEAGEAYYFLASAGMDAEQQIDALPQVADFAQAGMFDLATATDLATDAQSALGLSSDNAEENLENLERTTDVLVGANQLANASVEEFSESLTNMAGSAMRQAGMEIEEGTAALAVFADQGYKGNRAGTILARTIEGLEQNARNNSDAFEEYGIQVYNADGEMRNMADIMDDMEDGFAGMTTEQRNAAMEQLGFNQRTQQGINMLYGNSDALRQYEGDLRDAGGATQEVAEKQLQTFWRQLEMARGSLADIAIGIGQVFLPALTTLMTYVATAIDRFAEWSHEMNGLPGAVALVSTFIGGLIVVAQQLGGVIGASLIPSIGTLITVLGTLIAPVVAVGAVIGTAAAIWTTNFAGIRDTTLNSVSYIQDILASGMGAIVSTVSESLESVTAQFQWVRLHTESAVKMMVSTLKILFRALHTGMFLPVQEALTAIDRMFGEVTTGIITLVADFAENISMRFREFWGNVLNTTFNAEDDITMAVNAIAHNASETLVQGLEYILDRFQAGFEMLTGFWRTHSDTIDDVTSIISNIISTFVGVALEILQQFGTYIWENIGPAFEFVRDVAVTAFERISETISSTWDTAVSIFGPMVEWLINIGEEFGFLSDDVDTTGERVGDFMGLLVELKTPIDIIIEAIGILRDAWVEDFMGIRTTTEESIQEITGFLESIDETVVQPGLEAIGEVFGISMESYGEITELGFEDIREILSESLFSMDETTTEQMGFIGETFGTSWSEISETTDEIFGGMIDGISELMNFMYEDNKETLDRFAETFSMAFELISSIATEVFEGLLIPMIQRVGELWRDHGDDVMNIVETMFALIYTVITETLDAVSIVLHHAVETMLTAWDMFGSELMSIIEFAFDIIVTTVEIGVSTLSTVIDVALAVIEGDWAAAWDSISEHLSNVLDAMSGLSEEWGGRFLSWLTGFLSDAFNAFVDWAHDLVFGSLIPDMFNEFLSIAETFGSDLIAWLTTLISDFISDVDAWVSDVIADIDTFLTELFSLFDTFDSDLLTLIAEMISNFISDVEGWVSDVVNEVETFVSDLLSEFESFEDDLLRLIDSLISDFISDVESWASDVVREVENFVSDILSVFDGFESDVFRWLSGMVSDFVRDIMRWGIDATREVRNMASDMLSELDITSDFRSAGQSLITSFASGISSRISNVRSSVSDAVSAARSYLPGSPADTGPLADSDWIYGLPESIISGIQDELRNVDRMADKLADRMHISESGDLMLNASAMGAGGGGDEIYINIEQIVVPHADSRSEARRHGDAFAESFRDALRSGGLKPAK